MHIVNPTPEQVDELHSMRFRHPCPAVQRRAEIVLLAAHYVAYGKIARILGIHANTVTQVLALFNSDDVEELTKWREGDADGELAAFDALMREHWRVHPPSTVKEAAGQLEEVTGVKRSMTAVRCFMKSLGFKRRKAGSVPGKADPEKQRQFIREAIEPRMSAAAAGIGVVYFMAASHFVFGAFLPSYSPNLNLIGRFWKYVKKTSLTNRAFSDFAQFRAAIDACMEDAFKKHAEELKMPLAPKFQIIEFSQLQAA